MGILEAVAWGIVGGVGAEAAVWFAIRHQRPHEYPHWTRSRMYWGVTLFMVILGGVLVFAHSRYGTELNPFLAMNVGASAPLAFRKLSEVVPRTPTAPDPNRID